jgi:hypothetical protein
MELDKTRCAFVVGNHSQIRGARYRMGPHYFDANENYLASMENGEVVQYEIKSVAQPAPAAPEQKTVIRGMDRPDSQPQENPNTVKFREWAGELKGMKGRQELINYCKEHLEFVPEKTVKLEKLRKMAVVLFEQMDAA